MICQVLGFRFRVSGLQSYVLHLASFIFYLHLSTVLVPGSSLLLSNLRHYIRLTIKSKIMAKTITQKVVFKNATTSDLYELYMNAKKHSAATGTATKISEKEGAKYSAGDDYITGKNLVLLKNKMIVQTWKAADWDQQEQDSIFILTFEQRGKDAVLNMVHANLPDKHAESIKKGWTIYYWNPWKAYLSGNPLLRMTM